MSILRLGVGGSTYAETEEPFSLGSVNVDCIEIFEIQQAAVGVSFEEPFSLLGPASAETVEPFVLGETIIVGTVEPFSISSPLDSWLGTGSPASPKMGWRDRSS